MLSTSDQKLITLVCNVLIDLHGFTSFILMLNRKLCVRGSTDNPLHFFIALSSDDYGWDFFEEAEEEEKEKYGDDFPYDGVSFEYGDKYVILSFDEAEKEILRVIKELGFSDKMENNFIFPKDEI